MINWLKNWIATEPAIIWTYLANAVAAGTIWGALPVFGIHLTGAQEALIVLAFNALNAPSLLRANVSPPTVTTIIVPKNTAVDVPTKAIGEAILAAPPAPPQVAP